MNTKTLLLKEYDLKLIFDYDIIMDWFEKRSFRKSFAKEHGITKKEVKNILLF